MLRGYLKVGPVRADLEAVFGDVGPGQDGPRHYAKKAFGPLSHYWHNYAPSQIRELCAPPSVLSIEAVAARWEKSGLADGFAGTTLALMDARAFVVFAGECFRFGLVVSARAALGAAAPGRVLSRFGGRGAFLPRPQRPRRNATRDSLKILPASAPHAITRADYPDGGSRTTHSSSPSPESQGVGAPGPSIAAVSAASTRSSWSVESFADDATTFPVARSRSKYRIWPSRKARTRSTAPSTSFTSGTTRISSGGVA